MRGTSAPMLTRIAALITAATFVLCAVPKTVRAAAPPATPSTSAPVTVQGCSADGKRLALNVNFTNASSQEVTKVHFAIADASGPLAMVDDVGSYAPGEIVHHPLRVNDADGSVWYNPLFAPAAQ